MTANNCHLNCWKMVRAESSWWHARNLANVACQQSNWPQTLSFRGKNEILHWNCKPTVGQLHEKVDIIGMSLDREIDNQYSCIVCARPSPYIMHTLAQRPQSFYHFKSIDVAALCGRYLTQIGRFVHYYQVRLFHCIVQWRQPYVIYAGKMLAVSLCHHRAPRQQRRKKRRRRRRHFKWNRDAVRASALVCPNDRGPIQHTHTWMNAKNV